MGKKRVVQEKEGEVSTAEVRATSQNVPKKRTALSSARFYVSASYNNTQITVTDGGGNVIAWSSAGSLGFKGPKKSTPYAASKVVENVFEKLSGMNLGKVSLFIQGVGSGRDAAIRAAASKGIDIVFLRDITPMPHNGCRPRKARRV